MNKTIIRTMAVLAAVGALMLPSAARFAWAADAPAAQEPGTKHFTLVAVEIDGAKFWLPSTITVDQGDKVKLTLKNNIPGASNQHGFSIPAYNVTTIVTRGTDTTVEFTADKPGVFPYICQLHPAHIGGQLEVEPKK
ncbi:MAG TPA: cupredoxin domain-containing protein [Candidatus Binataceae bacterium]|nr:cupredoxin domain-containing protein [Candidatus Binataceae bacterium]